MKFGKILGVLATLSLAFAAAASANDGAAAAGGNWHANIAAAVAISLAVIGGAMAQSKAGVAALEGIARNPAAQGKIFVPMIITLALIESLVLYAFVIAFVKIQ